MADVEDLRSASEEEEEESEDEYAYESEASTDPVADVVRLRILRAKLV